MSAAEHLIPDGDDLFLDSLEPVLAKYRDTKERRWHLHSLKCLRLARDLETYEALLEGRKVPATRVDPDWRKAYGY